MSWVPPFAGRGARVCVGLVRVGVRGARCVLCLCLASVVPCALSQTNPNLKLYSSLHSFGTRGRDHVTSPSTRGSIPTIPPIMARRVRRGPRQRVKSARWWRTLRLSFPTQREVMFLRAHLRLAREVAVGYVAALVKHCDRIVQVVRRGRAVAWWEEVLTAGLPEDRSRHRGLL